MLSMIAFDLDGVLVPDYSHIEGLNHQQFYEYTMYAKPLINPVGKFDIVTARSEQYRTITEQWIKQLKTAPQRVIMKANKDESPADYKIRMCRTHGYDVFVESDADIVKEMTAAKIEGLTVVYFDEYVTEHLNSHTESLFNFINR